MNRIITSFFSENIYPECIIFSAVQDYSDICKIDIKKVENGWLCNFSNSCYELALTEREFGNYLIELINAAY